MSTNETSTEDGGGSILPDWLIDRKEALIALSSVSAFLVSFARDPLGTIVDLLRWFVVEQLLVGAGWVGERLEDALDVVVSALATAVNASFGAAGREVTRAVGSLIGSFDTLVRGLAAESGPLAPLVVLVFYGIVMYALLWLVITAYRSVIRVAIKRVVPV